MFGICSKCNQEKEFYRGKVCKECTQKRLQEWYTNNKQSVLDRNAVWKENNKEKYLGYFHNRYANNKDEMNRQNKEYCKVNRREVNVYKKKWRDDKYRNDLNFRIKCILRARVKDALNGKCKSHSTLKLLGCTVEELKQYIEKQFAPSMSWDNYGFGDDKWHIDHIRPCSSFNLINEEEQLNCFNYRNLQPLWQKDNLSKSDNWVTQQQG